jgi:hypothetical protein
MTTDALKELTPLLEQMQESDVQRPKTPIAIFLSEGAAMLAALEKRQPLVKTMLDAGLDPDAITDHAPKALAALQLAQSSWIGDRRGLTAQEIIDQLTLGYQARMDALDLCAFYARSKREAVGRISVIREGEGDADMIDDLRALAAFYREEAPLFARRKKFDPAKQADALSKLADKLDPLLESKLLGTERRAALSLRDRAYTHAEAVLDELRDYGRLVTKRGAAADRLIFSEPHTTQLARASRAQRAARARS